MKRLVLEIRYFKDSSVDQPVKKYVKNFVLFEKKDGLDFECSFVCCFV